MLVQNLKGSYAVYKPCQQELKFMTSISEFSHRNCLAKKLHISPAYSINRTDMDTLVTYTMLVHQISDIIFTKN